MAARRRRNEQSIMMPWLANSARVLEVVPPPLRLGEAGIQKRLTKVAEIHESARLDAVNIPEIREEASKSADGVRKSGFEERVEPRDLARRIQEELDIPAVINRVVVHLERDKQCDWLRETHEEYGIQGFVLVGGERSGVDYPGPSVPECNELIRDVLGDTSIRVGNIAIPSRRSKTMAEPERMARKAAGGVDFFTTQIVYHGQEFTTLLDELHERQPSLDNVPILLSLCPVKTAHNLSFLRWLGVQVSADLEAQLCAGEDLLSASIQHVVELWNQVQTHKRTHQLPHPIGLNVAPVGPIPNQATAALLRQLQQVQVS